MEKCRFHEVKVSAPSKVILFGEHAVVYGMTAVAASLDLRTRMRIKPHKSRILVNFPDVGLKESWSPEQLKTLFQHKPNTEILDVNYVYLDLIHNFLKTESSDLRMASVICFLYLYSLIMDEVGIVPMEILVESEIPLGAGLGSSAALSVCLSAGLIGVLHQVQGYEKSIFEYTSSSIQKEVCGFAFLSEKILHGTPSGIDNSISTYGGMCRFEKGNLEPVRLERNLRILLINTNTFRNTKDLVERVGEKRVKYPDIVKPILESIHAISEQFLTSIQEYNQDLNEKKFYKILEDLMDTNQSLLTGLGVSHPTLDDVCRTLKKLGIVGKLTGAGGGGFALAVLPPSISGKTVLVAKDLLETKGYTCYQADIGVNGYVIEVVK
ncbi:mevalonate kinase [Eurytemora carolleeae]|uniref:mevalonate kinase n=1 Tax=Eurytemora carolleeae TaxID=1294199 RepID=UPI000C76E3AC|nr:mevalonate kinase [Eurytemora carolleeae]|eukprot:XP_023326671.1 mevalonate kinase-like [Eurytemora affinis]